MRDIPAHSDASSESIVSYDFTASEVSFNPNTEMGRSQSLKEVRERDRSRSKSADRNAVGREGDERARPLTSHPVLSTATPSATDGNERQGVELRDDVPPVPPLPVQHSLETQIPGVGEKEAGLRKGRSVRLGTKKQGQGRLWAGVDAGDEGGLDLEGLLRGIESGGSGEGKEAGVRVVRPPY